MCGLAGIYNSDMSAGCMASIAQKLVQKMRHRGPDDDGYEIFQNQKSSKRSLFAHTRLSILDTSNDASQPMMSSCGRYALSFNGAIYNFMELRKQLSSKGHSFKSSSDTEVIVQSFAEWGIECFSKFVGMWALAIIDVQENFLYLCRDRSGVKPLYFSVDRDSVCFGSTTNAVRSLCPRYEVNLQSIFEYVNFRQPISQGSYFLQIDTVEPGTCIVFKKCEQTTFRYWRFPEAIGQFGGTDTDIMENIRERLELAVKYRLVSDVDVGAFLSGGLDSSLIVAIICKQMALGGVLKTFSVGFDNGFDEFKYAREVADHFQTDHTELKLNAEDYISGIKPLIELKDAPLSVPNEVAIMFLSSVASDKNVKVLLSGEGADEAFGGYGRIFRSAYDFLRQKDSKFRENPVFKENFIAKYGCDEFETYIDHFIAQYSYLGNREIELLIEPNLLNTSNIKLRNYLDDFFFNYRSCSLTRKYMTFFNIVHLGGLLSRLDNATMAGSIEGRVPFTDHQLLEASVMLPEKFLMKWRDKLSETQGKLLNSDQISENLDVPKYVLKELGLKYLPANIVNRKKVGFPVPLAHWMNSGQFDILLDELISSDNGLKHYFKLDQLIKKARASELDAQSSHGLWSLININTWLNTKALSL
jgi:asparagine synthase (glutamine-hydrolysing)